MDELGKEGTISDARCCPEVKLDGGLGSGSFRPGLAMEPGCSGQENGGTVQRVPPGTHWKRRLANSLTEAALAEHLLGAGHHPGSLNLLPKENMKIVERVRVQSKRIHGPCSGRGRSLWGGWWGDLFHCHVVWLSPWQSYADGT